MKTDHEQYTIDELLNLASDGNMAAREMAIEKLRGSESALCDATFCQVAGQRQINAMRETIRTAWDRLDQIQKIGKTPVAKLADEAELR